MDETLKSIKSTYHIVTIICAIVCAFSFSMNNIKNPYDQAKIEIEGVYSALTDSRNLQLEEVNKVLNDNKIVSVIENHFGSRLDKNFKILPSERFDKLDIDNLKLDFIRTYIDILAHSNIYIFPPSILDNLLNQNTAALDTISNLRHITIIRPESGTNIMIVFNENLGLNLPPYNFSTVSTADYFTKKFRSSHNLSNEQGNLVDQPYIKSLWKHISELDRGSAVIELERMKNSSVDSSKEDLDILGIKISPSFLLYLVPFIIVSLIWYLYSLTNHLNSIKDTEFEKLVSFPYIGFFSDFSTKCIFFISVGIAPILSVGLICWKSDLSDNMKWTSFFLFCLISVIVSWALISKTIKIRSYLEKSSYSRESQIDL